MIIINTPVMLVSSFLLYKNTQSALEFNAKSSQGYILCSRSLGEEGGEGGGGVGGERKRGKRGGSIAKDICTNNNKNSIGSLWRG